MTHTPWSRAVLAFACLFFAAPATAPVPAADSTYDSKIAAARALALENSHAEARAVFADALALATDDEQKRWTQLWLTAEEVAADRSRASGPAVRSELARVLVGYENKSVPRDRFWAAAKAVEADTYWVSSAEALKLRFEIASFWAMQSATAENEDPFVTAATQLGTALASGEFDKRTSPLADSIALLRQAAAPPTASPRSCPAHDPARPRAPTTAPPRADCTAADHERLRSSRRGHPRHPGRGRGAPPPRELVAPAHTIVGSAVAKSRIRRADERRPRRPGGV